MILQGYFRYIYVRICLPFRLLQETYKGWTILGQVDLDNFVEANVTSASDFEENFKAVRIRRKDADKLPEMVKVGEENNKRTRQPRRTTLTISTRVMANSSGNARSTPAYEILPFSRTHQIESALAFDIPPEALEMADPSS